MKNCVCEIKLYDKIYWRRLFIKLVHLLVLISLIFTISAQGKCLDFEISRGAGWIDCNENPKENWIQDSSEKYEGSLSLRSGIITESLGNSSICRDIKGPSNITFNWKCSRNGGQILMLDNGRIKKILIERHNEPIDWQRVEYQIFDNDVHRIEWMFRRTNNNLSVDQFGWINKVCIDNGDMGDELPTVKLESPADNVTYYVDERVDFSFIPSDDQRIANCTLLIDGIEKNRSDSPKEGTTSILGYSFDTPGDYEWSIACCDNASQSTLMSRNISIEDPIPTIILDTPINNSQSYIGREIEFRYIPSDNKELENCTLILNGTEQDKERNYLPESDAINVFKHIFYNSGDYNWSVRCCDNLYQLNVSECRFISILPDEDPIVELRWPINNAILYADENITFEYWAADDKMVDNCTLIIDGKPVKFEAISKNDTVGNFSYKFGEDQITDDVETHVWTILCYDNKSKCNKVQDIRNISVLKDQPPIVVIEPIETAYVNRTVLFNYTAVDDKAIKKCLLLIDGKVCDDIPDDAMESFNYCFDQEGNHTWNITCWDTKDQSNSSEDLISIQRPRIILVNQRNSNETEYEYKLISDAIRDIASGGTIYVQPGIYKENLIINKELNLIGLIENESEKPKIISTTGDIPIKINSNNVSIERFEINGTSEKGGIYLEANSSYNHSNITIYNNKIVNVHKYGIVLWGKFIKIYNINITSNEIDGSHEAGIRCKNCSNGNISNNKIRCDKTIKEKIVLSKYKHVFLQDCDFKEGVNQKC